MPKLSAPAPATFVRRNTGDWAKLIVPKLEPQIEFSVGISSHELAKRLDFTVRRSCAHIPRTPLRTLHQLLVLPRRSALPNPCMLTARESHVLLLLACAQGWHSTPMVSILNKRSCCWVLQLRPRSDFGRLVHPRSKPLGGGRTPGSDSCRIGRDEFFTSDNDQGVFEHLVRLVDVLLVCTSTGLLIDRVRGASRCVCLCFLSWAAEMVGGAGGVG